MSPCLSLRFKIAILLNCCDDMEVSGNAISFVARAHLIQISMFEKFKFCTENNCRRTLLIDAENGTGCSLELGSTMAADLEEPATGVLNAAEEWKKVTPSCATKAIGGSKQVQLQAAGAVRH
jgi:hypothetical protein